jgi:hypothetical protein
MTKIKANANWLPITSNCSKFACDVMQYGGVSLFCLVIFGLFKLTKS